MSERWNVCCVVLCCVVLCCVVLCCVVLCCVVLCCVVLCCVVLCPAITYSSYLSNSSCEKCRVLRHNHQNLVVTIFSIRFNIHQPYVLPTQCIYVFCVDLRTNGYYFPIQH